MRLHGELVERAAKWLRAKCPVVITEMTSGASETPDAIGFHHRSIVIECKTSMADFRRDGKKPSVRRAPLPDDTLEMRRWLDSRMGDKRYYLVPSAIAEKVLAVLEEQDSLWGLLVAPELKSKRLVRYREARDNYMRNTHGPEIRLLISAIRRIGHDGPNLQRAVYVRAYTIVKGRGEPRATMGIRPED
jgi:hypothetical protein